ncbi:importin-alpha export receptor [Marasmius crinis-equi]|uniref:Importin-alpha export receptor n=1 Tax=Marasmius crinis-equi TaxID=585013 RepID=A0ABR3F2Q7_9AGAR
MADLPNLLIASLNPTTRKQAEQNLSALSQETGFLSHLLRLVLDQSADRAVRLSASVYLKNQVKLRWEEDVQPISEQDKAGLRGQLVPAMLALSSQADKSIRAQVAESVALIAELDFPSKWPDLIDQLVASLNTTDSNTILGVLHTAHSIFRQWRAHVRSDQLFTEINFVFEKFMSTFIDLFRKVAQTLVKNPNFASTPKEEKAILTQCMILLVEIYYDFTCQDIPPAIEDSHNEFFAGADGWFPAFMTWDPDDLRNEDPDDATPSHPSQLKKVILEVVELFVKLYPEQLQNSNAIPTFVQSVWSLIGSNKLTNVSDDPLVSQSLRFLSTAIRSGHYTQLFTSTETISTLVEGVVIPNVSLRQHELEQFEDDPLEYIRLDLSLGSTGGMGVSNDGVTRRQAAADVIKALVGTGGGEGEKITTEVVGKWIGNGLEEYSRTGKDKDSEGWKAKDVAIYLLTALATRGGTSQHGVTSTNALVDVVKFFSDHVFEDLQAEQSVHPILQVDAIRFLYTFRNQLTKPQLLSVLPLLARHLRSDNYVTYTYAAITIERVLAIRGQGNSQSQMLFNHTDVQEFAPHLIEALFTRIQSAGTPEKVAENDHLMKCIMRIIVTARQTLTPIYADLLNKLVTVLGVISSNPSNPKFDQYIFESISALMRFIVSSSKDALGTFEGVLFGPFTIILQNDIDQYIPYTFQILAQMLSLHDANTVPAQYESLLPFLLTPAVWAQKGSIPGLVRLLKAYLRRGAKSMVAKGQVASVLAVVQQRLIPSKANDVWGVELLMAVVTHVEPNDLKQYFRPVLMTLLTRMQTSKTDNYVYLFSKFLVYTMALDVEGLGPDYVIGAVEEIQPGLWVQIVKNFILPPLEKVPQKDKKLFEVGIIRMLFRSDRLVQPPTVQAWPPTFTALIKLFGPPGSNLKDTKPTSTGNDDDAFVAMTAIDEEEQSAGYQAAYSRLAASESSEVDPLSYVSDPDKFLGEEMVRFSKAGGQAKLKELLGQVDPSVVGPVIQSLAGAGYSI